MTRLIRYAFAWAILCALVIVPPELGLMDWRIWTSALLLLVTIPACRDAKGT